VEEGGELTVAYDNRSEMFVVRSCLRVAGDRDLEKRIKWKNSSETELGGRQGSGKKWQCLVIGCSGT
jgi:hypothetical protein